ncbi:MAG: hypothetical protein OEV40_26235 [Acidimicrobiia bacterium]|nr:hypothetical protein [Acidimicrobiia bacterium]
MARSDTSHLKALGAGPLEPSRELEVIVLDTRSPIEITFSTDELLARCPVTQQRDHYRAELTLVSSATLESKSLKLYLASWELETILAEDLANSIADDIAEVCGDHLEALAVELHQQVRGGIEVGVRTTRPVV